MALSAFDSFCRGAEQGRFPDLNNRNDLWGMLVLAPAMLLLASVPRAINLRKLMGGILVSPPRARQTAQASSSLHPFRSCSRSSSSS